MVLSGRPGQESYSPLPESGIHKPDSPVQCSRNSHPCDIGDEQVRGILLHPVKSHDGSRDHYPEDEDVDKAEDWRPEAEEEE